MFRWEEPEPDYEPRIRRLELTVVVLGVVLFLTIAALSIVTWTDLIQVRTDRSQNDTLDSLVTITDHQLKIDRSQNETIRILLRDAPRRK